MNGFHRQIRVAMAVSSLICAGPLWAADGERDVAVEINKANGLLRSGDVDVAVKAYRQVQDRAAGRADLSYNMAVAQYRKGDVAAAERLFYQASSGTNDALAAKACYNLGNCSYASALKQAESDHSAAIKGLEKAIENYRGALEIDSNDADSRANIELASAMIDKLRHQDKKQEQQQSQNQKEDKQKQQNEKQKNQQQQNKQQQDQQQQNQQQQQGSEQKDQKQENSKQPNNEQQNNSQRQQSKDQQQSQQNQQRQKSEPSQKNESKGQQGSQDKEQKPGEGSKNQSQDKSEPQSQEQKSQPRESKSEQKESKSEPNESKPQPHEAKTESQDQHKSNPSGQQQQVQRSSQQKSTPQRRDQNAPQQPDQPKDQQGSAAPKGALSAADQKTGKKDLQDKQSAGMPEAVQDGAMTTQEAEKMLQAIRDQEMIRRLRRQAAERNQQVPVDRDW